MNTYDISSNDRDYAGLAHAGALRMVLDIGHAEQAAAQVTHARLYRNDHRGHVVLQHVYYVGFGDVA